MVVEVVVYNFESAMKAQQGGADRIELCANPAEGGTTPSYGVIELVRQHLNIDVYVMIRPRGGDFLYSIEEYHAMKKDIEACKKLSVDGVVFGVLEQDGRIDKEKCKKLISQARPMKVTCHRAFDMTPDPYEALEDCIESGFDRILTSGQHKQAILGVDVIAKLINRANGRIIIMPGAGVNENTAAEITAKTRAREIHCSVATQRESGMRYRNNKIAGMGAHEGAEFKILTVDPERIKVTRNLAEAALLL
jgi:copper homeostasis protein